MLNIKLYCNKTDCLPFASLDVAHTPSIHSELSSSSHRSQLRSRAHILLMCLFDTWQCFNSPHVSESSDFSSAAIVHVIVYNKLCGSLELPTLLIFSALFPHLHLSPPPRSPHPSLSSSLTPSLSPRLSFCPPSPSALTFTFYHLPLCHAVHFAC